MSLRSVVGPASPAAPGLEPAGAEPIAREMFAAAAPTPYLAANVPDSGRTIHLVARDGSGNPAGITQFATPGEIQDITIEGVPAGSATEGVASTAPVSNGGGGAINLGFRFVANQARYVTALGVYQGPTTASTAGQTITLADVTAGSAAGQAVVVAQVVAGTPLATGGFNYYAITPVQLTVGSTYGLFVSLPGADQQYVSGTMTLDPAFTLDLSHSQSQYSGPGSSVPGSPSGNLLSTSFLHSSSPSAAIPSVVLTYMGQSTGPIPLTASGGAAVATGGPASVQAALASLPAIGAGAVDVAQGPAPNVYRASWAGLEPHPMISAPAGVASVAEVLRGGAGITLTVNGGTPTPLNDWCWGVWNGGNPSSQIAGATMASAICPLFQSAPAVQTFPYGQLPFVPGGVDGNFLDESSLSITPGYAVSPGRSIACLLDGLPAGTYSPAITWRTVNTYQYANYLPATAAVFLVQDGSGNTLATVNVDQSQAPAGYQDASGRGWLSLGSFSVTGPVNTLKVVATTQGLPQAAAGQPQQAVNLDGVQLARTSPDLSVVIRPADVCVLNVPAGLIETTAGPIPATPSLACPRTPTLPPFVADAKTLLPGYNVDAGSYFSNLPIHSNVATLLDFDGGILDPATGYPTRLRTSATNGMANLPAVLDCLVSAATGSANLGDPREGTASYQGGLWTLLWDGDVTIPGGDHAVFPESANGFSSGITIVESNTAGRTNATGNRIVFRPTYPAGLAAAPYFRVRFQSGTVDPSDPTRTTCLLDIANLALYPPDPSDPTGNTAWVAPPKFHPWFVQKLQGMSCLRYLGPTNVNGNPCGSLADYKPAGYLDRANSLGYALASSSSTPVATIQAPQGSWATYFPPLSDRLVFQVTTPEPHGLFDACRVQFSGLQAAQFAGGPADLTQFYQAYAKVIDATNFLVVGEGPQAANGTAMTNVITGGSFTTPGRGTLWPLEDMIDLAIAAGVPGIWPNISLGMDTTPGGGMDQLVAAFLARTRPGFKFYCELGNECWNPAFDTNHWCVLENAALTRTFDEAAYATWFVQQTKRVHDRAAAVMEAAGRGADLVRVLGTRGGGGRDGSVAAMFQEAASLGMRIDQACMANYYRNHPAGGVWNQAHMPTWHSMTADQLLDYLESVVLYGGYVEEFCSAVYTAIATVPGYENTKVVAYEGSSEVLVPLDPPDGDGVPPDQTPNFFPRQLAMKRSPRHHGIVLAWLQAYQDAGLALWNWFFVGGYSDLYCWDLYEYGDQQDGTGDPTLDTLNVATPQAKNAVLAEGGGAWHRWASLVAPQATTTTGSKKLVPGRNGRLGAGGLPRGLNRLVGPR